MGEESMKKLFTAGVLCALAITAQAADQKKSDNTATTAPKAVTIPKDAVRNANGTYSYTDKDGKKWVFMNSPFGVIKSQAKDTDDGTVGTRVIDKGDTVRFERPSPFGTIKWEKKKSELTDAERKLVEAQKQPETAGSDAK